VLGKNCFFLARIANGGVVGHGPDELSRVSEMFRPVAERLLAVPPEGQQRVWDDFLAGRLRPSPINSVAPELGAPTAAGSQEPKLPASAHVATGRHGDRAGVAVPMQPERDRDFAAAAMRTCSARRAPSPSAITTRESAAPPIVLRDANILPAPVDLNAVSCSNESVRIRIPEPFELALPERQFTTCQSRRKAPARGIRSVLVGEIPGRRPGLP
jgi:hypothetical protein